MNSVAELREQLQEDMITYLDGHDLPQEVIDGLCQIIVDRAGELEDELNIIHR